MPDSIYPPLPIDSYLYDAAGNPIESERGAIGTHDADVHHVPVNELFHYHPGITTTLAADVDAGDRILQLTNGAIFANQDSIQISNGVIETTFPIIVSGGGTNTVTLDRPLDHAFLVGAAISLAISNMAMNGSITPISFKHVPDPGQIWHIETFILTMVHGAAADDTKFGGLATLSNGCVIRGYNGLLDQYRTLAVWKSNSDIKSSVGKVEYSDKAGGGKYGVTADGGIKERTGAVPEIIADNGDFLEYLIQDDLTEVGSSITFRGLGHIEGL